MRRKLAAIGVLVVAVLSSLGAQAPDLEAGFRSPPDEARPGAYWLWLNGYLNRDHVETELKSLHAAGIRSLCLFDMGATGDKSCVPMAGPAFLSDRSVGDIAHAVRIAGRLGMTVELSVASSWDMGGAWVEPRHASMGLYDSEVEIEGPIAVDRVLPMPPVPASAPRDAQGRPAFAREVAVLAVPAVDRSPGFDFVLDRKSVV
jgi:hypothetical protein